MARTQFAPPLSQPPVPSAPQARGGKRYNLIKGQAQILIVKFVSRFGGPGAGPPTATTLGRPIRCQQTAASPINGRRRRRRQLPPRVRHGASGTGSGHTVVISGVLGQWVRREERWVRRSENCCCCWICLVPSSLQRGTGGDRDCQEVCVCVCVGGGGWGGGLYLAIHCHHQNDFVYRWETV